MVPKGSEPVFLYQLPPDTVGTGLQEGQGRGAGTSAEDTREGELGKAARQRFSPPYAVPLVTRYSKFFSKGGKSFSGRNGESRRDF